VERYIEMWAEDGKLVLARTKPETGGWRAQPVDPKITMGWLSSQESAWPNLHIDRLRIVEEIKSCGE